MKLPSALIIGSRCVFMCGHALQFCYPLIIHIHVTLPNNVDVHLPYHKVMTQTHIYRVTIERPLFASWYAWKAPTFAK